MKRWILLAGLLNVCVLGFCGCGGVEKSFQPQDYLLNAAWTPGGPSVIPASEGAVDLVAGRTEVVGAVEWRVEGDVLRVRYATDGRWKLAATHLAAAASFEDLPATNSGNPRVGWFPFKKEFDGPVDECEFAIALGDWGLDGVDEAVIAAHADVVLVSERGSVIREEGAWGSGSRFAESAADSPGEKGSNGEGGGSWAMYFRVTLKEPTTEGLLINELFYCGSDAATFYFYDQFVELHNGSGSTIYLDGIIITRQSQMAYPDQETVPFVRATYAFQFPGTPVTGRQYPIEPGDYVVIAADAVNHKQWCQNAIDLSGADWEFFNPLSSDYDNPAVPNVVSIVPSSTVDFMINLIHNAVVAATGESYTLDEYEPGKFHVRIPIETIIDGVEYAPASTYEKQLTSRVDAGFAGNGCARYSGRSVERGAPGLDTNNSTSDFVLTAHPTPGSSHAAGGPVTRTVVKDAALVR